MFRLEWLRNQKGSAAEYAIIAVLIAAFIIGAVTLFGGQVKAIFDSVANIVQIAK